MDDDQLKLAALEAAVYCPTHKDESAICTITVDDFDIEKIKDNVRASVDLLSYNTHYKPSILEILDVLDQNKHVFLIDQQKYIGFYWNGILVVMIEIKKEVSHSKQLHVSLQKYRTEKQAKMDEKSLNRAVVLGAGTTVLASLIIAGWTLFK
jgi:hypothetical protein